MARSLAKSTLKKFQAQLEEERERLLELSERTNLDGEERRWLAELADDYGLTPPVDGDDGTDGWGPVLEELAVRVDEVAVSLVLAQSAK